MQIEETNMPRSDIDDDDRDDDLPRKKKKKKKKQAPSPLPKIAAFVAAGVVGVGLVVLLIWVGFSLAGGTPAKAVTAWENISTDEMGFGFDYPAGWGAKSYGKSPNRVIEVKSVSTAKITVNENLSGSLVGDIAGAGIAGQQVDDSRLPVSRVHEMRKPKEPASYKEEPAVTVMTKFGKGRMSAYTDGSRRGYRATVLLNQTALDIFCDCRVSDWDTLRPAFERVIQSMGHSGGFARP